MVTLEGEVREYADVVSVAGGSVTPCTVHYKSATQVDRVTSDRG